MARIINIPIDLEATIKTLGASDGEGACALLTRGLKDYTDAQDALDRARLARAKAESPAKAKREVAARIAAAERVVAREEQARAIARLSPATLAKAKAKGLTAAQLIAKRASAVRREGGVK